MGKENEKTGPETKRKALFCQTKKKTPCRKRQRLLVWRNCWRSGEFENPFGAGFAFAFTFGVFAHYYVVVLNWIALSTGVPNSRFEESIKYWWFMSAYWVRRDCLKCVRCYVTQWAVEILSALRGRPFNSWWGGGGGGGWFLVSKIFFF